MSDRELFFYVALGIVVSVILPILSNAVRKAFPVDRNRGDLWQTTWRSVRKYVLLAIFSLVTATVVFAIYKANLAEGEEGIIQHWWSAFLYGYMWDSTLQKFVSR